MYADYSVSGGGIDSTESYEFVCEDKTILDMLESVEKRIKLKQMAWSIVRAMCRDGDAFAENVFDDVSLAKVKVLPAQSMYRIEDKLGNLPPDKAFVQRAGSKEIVFAQWQITHFRLVVDPCEIYGRSILYPIRRLAKELGLIEDALTIARLTRAHQRWLHTIDTTGMNPTQRLDYIRKIKMENRRRRLIDPQTGRFMVQENPLRAEEDIYQGKSKDSVDSITTLNGDSSINNIGDVQHKYDRIFTGLVLSKAWFGLTGPNLRSIMGEQGLNFMRAVRRVRSDFKVGAHKTYVCGLRAKGISYEQIEESNIDYRFPMMSHQDDELRYKLDVIRLSVAEKNRSLGLMSRKDILVEIFKKTAEEADKLLGAADKDQAQKPEPGPPPPSGEPSVSTENIKTAVKDALSEIGLDLAIDNVSEHISIMEDSIQYNKPRH
jgi:hypothetical protein